MQCKSAAVEFDSCGRECFILNSTDRLRTLMAAVHSMFEHACRAHLGVVFFCLFSVDYSGMKLVSNPTKSLDANLIKQYSTLGNSHINSIIHARVEFQVPIRLPHCGVSDHQFFNAEIVSCFQSSSSLGDDPHLIFHVEIRTSTLL